MKTDTSTRPELSVLDLLISAYDRNRLGHALLLVSADEKSEIFQKNLIGFFASLLCLERKAHEPACKNCDSCRLIGYEFPPALHPDAVWMQPETANGYTVDQIRSLHAKVSLKRSLSPNRVIWVPSAELLSASGGAAGNAFLKILEEPRPETFLVLTSAQPDSVLTTLRSRCQSFRFAALTSPSVQLSEDLNAWAGLLEWLRRGAEPHAPFRCPADEESFWEDRSRAVLELQHLHLNLWSSLKSQWNEIDREGALKVLDFFHRLESLILKVRAYANPHLQWLSLRSDARLGILWTA